jgi:hypothetical protein
LSTSFSFAFGQQLPSGFKIERYARVWERNPFTLVTPAPAEKHVSPFDSLFLASWLKDGRKEVVLVQNSETNELQRITIEPNENNLRLIEIRSNPNPQLVEAVISDGKEQGAVRFRFDVQSFTGQTPPVATGQASNPNEAAGMRGSRPSQSIRNSQSQSTAAIAPAHHSVYPSVARVHSEGGSSPGAGPQQTQNKHASPDSPPRQSLPNQS